ncbi:hypothetical protein GLOIN_2v1787176 [Rhizophagus irregularis DAOM 181602=DAOM 197198]|nr:hypothetical protein GLOIN_2v1787176 [Rhizophagus irregularis DAOM 181602=DAOM 197198]
MASTTNNFILQELGDFLKLLDKETFAFLLEQMLQVLRTTILVTSVSVSVLRFTKLIYQTDIFGISFGKFY